MLILISQNLYYSMLNIYQNLDLINFHVNFYTKTRKMLHKHNFGLKSFGQICIRNAPNILTQFERV